MRHRLEHARCQWTPAISNRWDQGSHTRCRLTIRDPAGDGDHYLCDRDFRVIPAANPGVQQHQIVHPSLQGQMGGVLYALALQTGVPGGLGMIRVNQKSKKPRSKATGVGEGLASRRSTRRAVPPACAERAQPRPTAELFFDPVFVFAVTQVVTHLARLKVHPLPGRCETTLLFPRGLVGVGLPSRITNWLNPGLTRFGSCHCCSC